MSNLLQIVGSHKLYFTSGKDVINQFQSIFNVEIQNATYNSNEVNSKHDNSNQIRYFVALDYLEQNFNRWNQVKILTDYKFCHEINIHRQSLSYDIGCSYKYWKCNLLEEHILEDLQKENEFFKTYWEEVHRFSSNITKQLGGEMQIYFLKITGFKMKVIYSFKENL